MINIAFIMDPWDEINPEIDSTLRIVHEAVLRNYKVGIIHSDGLTIRNSTAMAYCKLFPSNSRISSNMVTFYKKVEFQRQMLPLSGFDVIFMRENPPLDVTTLNFLDSVKHDTFIINDIGGLRVANNKLYTSTFHDPSNEFIPVTHVSRSKDYLRRVIEESENEKMILKPLNGYGGSGVIVIEKRATQNINSLLDFYISSKGQTTPVILQEYIEGAEEGDVRVLMLNGEPIGAMRRVPAQNDLRSNVHAGGSAVKHTLTKQERLLCKKIGPKLVADGLFLVGLDIIRGKLIEVNVCSPGGITRINRFNHTRLQQKILDFVEQVVQQKEYAIQRKIQLKREVEDAHT